jgi:hypothetical protein
MGNSQSHKRNVFERHTRALYVNIPVSESIKSLLVAQSPRVRVSKLSGQSYLSIVVDDLCNLSAWVGVGFLPTPMSGWMMKFNLLVDVNMPEADNKWQPAYQIMTLDFERGVGGKVKQIGAIASQKVPSHTTLFNMSCGTSGNSTEKPMIAGAPYSAHVQTSSNECLLRVIGTLKEMSESEKAFATFIVERPHKVLAQNNGRSPAHAPEDGEGAIFSAEGAMKVDFTTLELTMVKRRIQELILTNHNRGSDLSNEAIEKMVSEFDIDYEKVTVFLQPEYVLLDHTNLPL